MCNMLAVESLKANTHSRRKYDLRHDFAAAARFCGVPIHTGKYAACGICGARTQVATLCGKVETGSTFPHAAAALNDLFKS